MLDKISSSHLHWIALEAVIMHDPAIQAFDYHEESREEGGGGYCNYQACGLTHKLKDDVGETDLVGN